MKKVFLMLSLLAGVTFASAQTLNVEVGDVTFAFPDDQTGDMTFTGSQWVTICDREFPISDITRITVTDDAIADNTISVTYAGTSARVVVAGNIARYIDAEVSDANVKIIADENLPNEVTYTLQGASEDGSFYMDGELKATFILNGLTLSCPDSAAVNIQCGKLITMVLADGSSNTLTDGITGTDDGLTDSHKAPLVINGHSEWSGSGSLTLYGNVRHGFFADEYVLLQNGLGTIRVANAAADGFHINEYLRMQGGTVNISAQGDGLDVGAKTSSTANDNGRIVVEGGSLTISTSGVDVKGMKSDARTIIAGGTVSVTATGDGSKGVSSSEQINITGGKTTVVTTGNVATIDNDEKKPHGMKAAGDITLSGGEVYVAAGSDSGKAFDTDTYLYSNGATLMGIGGKASTPSVLSTHTYNKYKDVNVKGGATVSYDGVSFTVPAIYSNSSAKILVSK